MIYDIFLYHKTKLLIGIMNKTIIQIGSLCILIILIIGLFYFNKIREGFIELPVPNAATSLTTAKQSITVTNAAIDAAKNAVGSPTEVSTAKDAFSKATASVTAANSAVADTKAAFGALNIPELEKIASTAKTNWANAQKLVDDKNQTGSIYKAAEADVDPNNPNSAVAKAAVAAKNAADKKVAWEQLPN